jgi:hypothetical protein
MRVDRSKPAGYGRWRRPRVSLQARPLRVDLERAYPPGAAMASVAALDRRLCGARLVPIWAKRALPRPCLCWLSSRLCPAGKESLLGASFECSD